ncbi:MAG: Uma2 family endonuclease [Candidatus Rokubacteria bacterium]|nr:Uma2 family endonuclease [Candidatus Rokubacteria bacterium]
MSESVVRTRRWSRLEYDRLIEEGVFQPGERLELLAGQLVVREPQGTPHATGIRLVTRALREVFADDRWIVDMQLPVALDKESEPEPDVTVTAGDPRDFLPSHPARPVLVVEVAEASLALDREEKGGLYARAHVPEYWILNLRDRVLEVYREPHPDPSAPQAWAYRSRQSLAAGEHVTPSAAPTARIAVADLLP